MTHRRLRDCPGQMVFDKSDENMIVRCVMCERILHTEDSRRAGIGPRCEKMRAKEEERREAGGPITVDGDAQ